MKANNGSGNIPERDEWRTPQELFDVLNKQYFFDFDCCATNENKKSYTIVISVILSPCWMESTTS